MQLGQLGAITTLPQYEQLNSCMKAARSKRRKRADVNPVRNSAGISRFDKHGIPSPCAIQAKDQTGSVKQSSVGVYDINHPAWPSHRAQGHTVCVLCTCSFHAQKFRRPPIGWVKSPWILILITASVPFPLPPSHQTCPSAQLVVSFTAGITWATTDTLLAAAHGLFTSPTFSSQRLICTQIRTFARMFYAFFVIYNPYTHVAVRDFLASVGSSIPAETHHQCCMDQVIFKSQYSSLFSLLLHCGRLIIIPDKRLLPNVRLL